VASVSSAEQDNVDIVQPHPVAVAKTPPTLVYVSNFPDDSTAVLGDGLGQREIFGAEGAPDPIGSADPTI
jgi:hypothetical protein